MGAATWPARNDEVLDGIRKLTDERDEANWAAKEVDTLWRERIAAAVRAGIPVEHVAVVAGVSRQRVYQIRDGRR